MNIQSEKTFIDRVNELYNSSQHAEAEMLCDECIAKHSNFSVAYYMKALIKIGQSKMDQARILLRMARVIEPDNICYAEKLYQVYLQLNQPEQAVSMLKVMLSLKPNSSIIADELNKYYSKTSLDDSVSKIKKSADAILDNTKTVNGPKVLYGPSFTLHRPCKVHDFLLVQALKLRGAQIVPFTIAHQDESGIHIAQKGENGFHGGIWGGYTGDTDKDAAIHLRNCQSLVDNDSLLWKQWCGLDPVSIASIVSQTDWQELYQYSLEVNRNNYKDWQYEDMPIGLWAVDVLFNNATIVEPDLIDDFDSLLTGHVFNCLLLSRAYNRLLDKVDPDIIITNDTSYYTWSILETIAKRRDITCYNHWQGARSNGWTYRKGQAVMGLDLSGPWEKFKSEPFTADQAEAIDEYLADRHKGAMMVLDTSKKANEIGETVVSLDKIDLDKHVTLLATNAMWDLTALNKDVVFDGMVDWVFSVIDYFASKPDKQLVIKAHPVENTNGVPVTKQSIGSQIAMHMPELPSNIYFIEPDAEISLYQLMPSVDAVLVYTSTVGLEMACEGKPVVTCAKSVYRDMGFTFDPDSKDGYFRVLDSLVADDYVYADSGNNRKLARKFFYLYFLRYYSSLNLFSHSYSGEPVLWLDDAQELLPGRNGVLDYICDSILNKREISSSTTLPPEASYNSELYAFDKAEMRRDCDLVLKGYLSNSTENIIETDGQLDIMQIDNHRFCVPTNSFKPGELKWLYDEIHLPCNVNPHVYEIGNIKINPGDVVIDLGACEGFFIDYALSRSASKVVAIEPHPVLAKCLEITYNQHINSGNVDVLACAVSNYNGTVHIDDGNTFICEAKINQQGRHITRAITFDSLVLENELDKVDFIKIDVEGEEMNAVRGMSGVLYKYKPRLSIAVYHDYNNANLVRDIILSIRDDYNISYGGCYLFEEPARPYMLYAY